MNILDSIVKQKRIEVAHTRKMITESSLEQSPAFHKQCNSLQQNLLSSGSSGIIAEFKRKSPSKGWINKDHPVVSTIKGYIDAGAAGVSILTDPAFFGGGNEDIIAVRKDDSISIPVLRKDFIIDEFQVIETKSLGADVMLLIAAILSKEEVYHLASKAKDLGLEVLLEIHTESELPHINKYIDFVGVNNRDLKTFIVDIQRSIDLAPLIPEHTIMISESGINHAKDVSILREHGFKGFLVGERFMREPDPGIACKEFIKSSMS